MENRIFSFECSAIVTKLLFSIPICIYNYNYTERKGMKKK